MERNELRSAAPAVCSVNNFLCILTPFFHSLFAPLILFPSYTHTHDFFLASLFSLALVIAFQRPLVTVTLPLAEELPMIGFL